MKKRFIYASGITLIAIALFVVACKKDRATYSDASGDNTITSLSVKDARKYFYNVLRKAQSPSVLSVTSSPDGKNRKVYPYWNHAYASKTKKFDFVELPVASVHQQRSLRTTGATMTDAESKSVLAASFTRLVLYKNKSGLMNQRLITFIPDYAYLKKHNNDVSYNHIDKLDKDFSGYLEYRDWNNKLLFTLKLANGVVVGRFKPGKQTPKQQVQSLNIADFKNKSNTDGCITYQVTVWEQDCIDFTDPDNPDAGVVTICGDWYIADQYYETECPDDIDCSDPANFDDAECGGGDDPNDPPPPPNPCDNVPKVNNRAANSIIASQNSTILANTIASQNEWGANQNLTSLTGSTYVNNGVSTNGASAAFNTTFSWDATNGYTVGYSHGHPGNTGPSPEDVWQSFYPPYNSVLKNQSASDIQFYKDNEQVTTETNTGSYIVTISDWNAMLNIYNASYSNATDQAAFTNNYVAYATDYLTNNPSAGPGDAGSYALMKLFPDAINVYYAAPGSTSYTPIFINQSTEFDFLSNTPCP